MADAKLSSYPLVEAIGITDVLPILQSGQNKLVTVGQLKTFSGGLLATNIADEAVPLGYNIIGIYAL